MESSNDSSVDMTDVNRKIDQLRQILPPTPYLLRTKSKYTYTLTPEQEEQWTKGSPFENGEEQYMTNIPWPDARGILEAVPGPPIEGSQMMSRSASGGSTSSGSSMGKLPRKKITLEEYRARKKAEAEAKAAVAGGKKVGEEGAMNGSGSDSGAQKEAAMGNGKISNDASHQTAVPAPSTVLCLGSPNGSSKRPSTAGSEDGPATKRQRTGSPGSSGPVSEATEEKPIPAVSTALSQGSSNGSKRPSTSGSEDGPAPKKQRTTSPAPAPTVVTEARPSTTTTMAPTTKRPRSPSLQGETKNEASAKRAHPSLPIPPKVVAAAAAPRKKETGTQSKTTTQSRQPSSVPQAAAGSSARAVPLPSLLLPVQLLSRLPKSVESRLTSKPAPLRHPLPPRPDFGFAARKRVNDKENIRAVAPPAATKKDVDNKSTTTQQQQKSTLSSVDANKKIGQSQQQQQQKVSSDVEKKSSQPQQQRPSSSSSSSGMEKKSTQPQQQQKPSSSTSSNMEKKSIEPQQQQPSTSTSSSSAKPDLIQAWQKEYLRLFSLGRKVKHESHDLVNAPENRKYLITQFTTDKQKEEMKQDQESKRARSALMAVEALCYFMLAFHADTVREVTQKGTAALKAVDHQSAQKGTAAPKAEVETTKPRERWATILGYWSSVEVQTRPYQYLHGLCLQLGAICRHHLLETCTEISEVKDQMEKITALWRAGYADLSIDVLAGITFRETFRKRQRKPLGGSAVAAGAGGGSKPGIYRVEVKDLETGREGGFFLPLTGITTALEAVRAGLSICGDWAKMKGFEWQVKVDI